MALWVMAPWRSCGLGGRREADYLFEPVAL
jgi:hypothetical protein